MHACKVHLAVIYALYMHCTRLPQAMVECRCPFLMGFFGAEQHNCVSYLLTEYMPGGDIKALMDMRKTLPIVEVRSYTLTTSFMPTIYALCIHCICTVQARFYFACVMSAVDEMHAKDWMHRDLKMENIMIGQNGYAKALSEWVL